VKKLLVKLVLTVVVALGISNYSLFLLTGKNPFANVSLPNLSFSSEDLDAFSSSSPLSSTETTYKWTDENGLTHYSSEAPAENKLVEVIEVNPNTNLIKGIDMAQRENTEEKTNSQSGDGSLYEAENIQLVLEKARNVEKLLQDRHEAQEEILNNI